MFERPSPEGPSLSKAFALFGIGAGVGLGLCGVSAMADGSVATMIGAGLFLFSALGLLITSLLWVVYSISGRYRG